MLAAAQSPPSPLGQRFGPALRHLAPLRTADWRQSVATPLPCATGEAEHQESVPERASLTFFFSKKKTISPLPQNLDPLGSCGESLRGEGKEKEKRAGESEARRRSHPPSLSHLSPFQSSPVFNILRDLKAVFIPFIFLFFLFFSWEGGDCLIRVPQLSGSTAAATVWTLLRSRRRYERIV